MESQVYKDMLDVMTKRGGPYAGMDIPEFYALVQELFTPEEAELNNALPRNPVTAAEISGDFLSVSLASLYICWGVMGGIATRAFIRRRLPGSYRARRAGRRSAAHRT